jgi:hypothetical protein
VRGKEQTKRKTSLALYKKKRVVCVCMWMRERVCVCVCVCQGCTRCFTDLSHTHTVFYLSHTHTSDIIKYIFDINEYIIMYTIQYITSIKVRLNYMQNRIKEKYNYKYSILQLT